MIYFSQLDLVRIFERGLRRSSLPLFFTQGFSPRVKMSFKNALKVGIEGTIEVTFYFTQQVDISECIAKLAPQLPQGLEIVPI